MANTKKEQRTAPIRLPAADKREMLRRGWTKEEVQQFEIQLDPVLWAETYLRNPENPREPLSVRWYQANMLRCNQQNKVYRCGRRVGKSIVLCIEMLWKAFCNDDKRILVCAPYKNQVQQLWKDGFNKLIKGNEFIEAAISRQSSNPFTIEFKNGSRIMGLTAGSKTGNKGSSIRGQCIIEGTDVILADGRIVKIENLTRDDEILSIDGNAVTKGVVSKIFKPNQKHVYQFTLSSGRKVSCSLDHAIYSKDGWVKAGDLKRGDRIATRLGSIDNDIYLNEDEVSFSAYMIGDGSCGVKTLRDNNVKFVNNNVEILRDFRVICNTHGLKVREHDKNGTTELAISGLKKSWAESTLKEYEVLGHLAYDKKVPDKILTASKRTKALFLRKLYSTDGWCCTTEVRNYQQVEVGYCTVSKDLADGVQSLLRDFGILSKIQERDKKLEGYNCSRQYIVKIRSRFFVKKFLEDVGYVYGKEAACDKVYNIVKFSYKPKDYKNLDGHLYFDNITSINYIGCKKTYDISVDKYHNFFADDIMVHNSADDLYLDEADYMGDEAIHSIIAIQATTQNTHLVISSTPTGRREFYYEACTNKRLGYSEFHFGSSVSPEWVSIEQAKKRGLPLSKSQEYLFRNQCPEHVYQHEYDAVFGEEAAGVFKHELIDKSMILYNPESEQMDPMGKSWWCGDEQNKKNVFILGIDWNGEDVGTQFVITEFMREPTDITYQTGPDNNVPGFPEAVELTTQKFQGKYRVYYRESVSVKDMTQLTSIKRVIELNNKFKIDHIYVDAGFGTTNIEELKLYGKTHFESGISEKLNSVEFGGSIFVYDPYTKEQIKKSVKPFMVFNAQSILERGELLLPESEDEKVKLVGQMREYRIEKFSPQGIPQFSRENDHILDAFMLSLYGFQTEYSELVKVQYSERVGMIKNPTLLMGGLDKINTRDIKSENKDPLAKKGIQKRAPRLSADKYTSDSRAKHMDYEELVKNKPVKGPFSFNAKAGWSNVGSPTRGMF